MVFNVKEKAKKVPCCLFKNKTTGASVESNKIVVTEQKKFPLCMLVMEKNKKNIRKGIVPGKYFYAHQPHMFTHLSKRVV